MGREIDSAALQRMAAATISSRTAASVLREERCVVWEDGMGGEEGGPHLP
jgi:hypothetical protein